VSLWHNNYSNLISVCWWNKHFYNWFQGGCSNILVRLFEYVGKKVQSCRWYWPYWSYVDV